MPLLLLVLLVLLLGSAPAQASTVTVADGALTYEASRGEPNRLTVRARGTDLEVADPGATTLGVGPGCRPAGPANTAACPASGVVRTVVTTGDGRDVVRLTTDLPSRVDAGSGGDEVAVGGATSFVTGGAGDDQLFGDLGDDVLAGGDGNDILQGAGGADRLFGGEGADELDGEDGADSVFGQDGEDLLTGGPGVDVLDGGREDDALDGGADRDRLSGGSGDDLIIAADREPDDVQCGAGEDSGRADGVDRIDESCEDLRVEGAGARIVRTLLPYPIVRIVGEVAGARTRVTRLQARVPSGTRVHVVCRGRSCPYRRRSFTARRAQTLTIGSLERRYVAGSQIEVYVTAPDRIGKYTRFVVRRGRAPRRTDQCVRGERLRAVPCGRA